MAETRKRKPVRVQLQLRYPVDPLPVSHVNVVRFSHVGSDVFMDVGIIDDQSLVRTFGKGDGEIVASEPNGTVSVAAFVQQRFGMTIDSLKTLRTNIDEIWTKMKAAGVVDDEEEA